MTLETILRKHIDNLDPNNKREYKKKTIELCHIGKLIISIDEGYSIATVGESPDVIIGNNIKKIGLEHVVLIESTQKEREGYLNNFFKLAEEAFSFKYPEKKFLVNIYLKETFPVVPKSQSHELIPQVIQIINEWIETNKMVENELIDHIYHMPFDKLDFEPNNGAWGSGILTNELLIKTINEKNKLINKYKSNSGINLQWLLIVIGSMGKSSYQMNDSIDFIVNSDFDRIYLLEDFNWKLNRIK